MKFAWLKPYYLRYLKVERESLDSFIILYFQVISYFPGDQVSSDGAFGSFVRCYNCNFYKSDRNNSSKLIQ